MPTIESRLQVQHDTYYDMCNSCIRIGVFVFLDGVLFHHEEHELDWLEDKPGWFIAKEVLCRILKEWPTCQDQTSSSEPQYRKTVVSSCGRLKVEESLS